MNEKSPDILRLERQVKQLEARMAAQKAQKPPTPKTVSEQLKDVLPPPLLPGNVGRISDVIWDFNFTFPYTMLVPGQAGDAILSITQEAAFVVTHISRSVFKRTGVSPNYVFTAIDTHDSDYAASAAAGLKYHLVDAQSSRAFHSAPEAIDNLGTGRYPTKLSSPLFFLPTSTIVCRFQNDSTVDTFVPWLTLYGYRVRVDEAQKVLSTVSG